MLGNVDWSSFAFGAVCVVILQFLLVCVFAWLVGRGVD